MKPTKDRDPRLDEAPKQAGGHSGHDIWIIPYADFMSTLMILFLMMYVFAYNSKQEKRYSEIITTIQQEMGGEVTQEVIQDMKEKEQTEKTVMEFDEMVEKEKLEKLVTVSVDSEKIKLSMTSPVLFDSGRAELKERSVKMLKSVANVLKQMDNDVVVEGHTDNVPITGGLRYRSNWELSQARAIQVIKYFVEKEKMSPSRFAATGYGEFRPVHPNDTPEHRELNRRIEINIFREAPKE